MVGVVVVVVGEEEEEVLAQSGWSGWVGLRLVERLQYDEVGSKANGKDEDGVGWGR
jgi:hypothetical protein